MPAASTDSTHKDFGLPDNLLWGAVKGLRGAAMFAVLSTLGRFVWGPELFGAVTYPTVVIAELSAGLAAGLIAGAFRPHLRSASTAAGIGFVAGIPVALIFRVALYGFQHWTGSDIFAVLAYACLVGPPSALLLWYRFEGREAPTTKG